MSQPSSRNLVLSRLSQADRALLDPYLKEVALPLRKVLERPGKRIKAAYFPESGFVSVVANDGKRPIEVGIIGREGMTGLPVILAVSGTTTRSTFRWQAAASAWRPMI